MNCPLEVKNIYVTSTNRDVSKYPYGNSYTLYLTTPIKDITNVELLYASVPNTMYNLNDGTDVIGFTDIANTVDNVVLHTIPPGFYGAGSMSTEIYNATQKSSNVCVAFLPGEGKFLFTRLTGFTMNIMTQEMASLLGFDFPCSINATDASTDPEYSQNLRYMNKFFIKSKYVVEMNPLDEVFLDIQELRTMYNECAPQGAPLGTTNNNTANRAFGMIPMDVVSGTIKRFRKMNDFDSQVEYTYPLQKIDRLTISWTDKTGKLLSFNGAEDNSFTLRFHTLRKNLCK
jgi:hypothetical protein